MRNLLRSSVILILLAQASDPADATSVEVFRCTAAQSWYRVGAVSVSTRCPAEATVSTPLPMQLAVMDCLNPAYAILYRDRFVASPSQLTSRWEVGGTRYAISINRLDGRFHYVTRFQGGKGVADVWGACTAGRAKQVF